MNKQRRLTGKGGFAFGDRVQARLILNGRIVADFITDRIADMTELLNAVRFRTRELRGLAQLYIRNLTRGWVEERPLMLYSRDLTASSYSASQPSFSTASVSTSSVSADDRYSRWMMM